MEFVLGLQVDVAHVEGVAKDVGEAAYRDPSAGAIPQAEIEKESGKPAKGIVTGRVPLEGELDERPLLCIYLLRLAGSAVQVPHRRGVRQEALLQSLLDAALRFFPQIPDVVRGDNRLDVCREPPAPGVHIDTLAGEVDRNASVDELSEIRPVLQVPGTPIHLVDDETLSVVLS